MAEIRNMYLLSANQKNLFVNNQNVDVQRSSSDLTADSTGVYVSDQVEISNEGLKKAAVSKIDETKTASYLSRGDVYTEDIGGVSEVTSLSATHAIVSKLNVAGNAVSNFSILI